MMNRASADPDRTAGLTLIELLVASALSTLLLSSVLLAISAIAKTRAGAHAVEKDGAAIWIQSFLKQVRSDAKSARGAIVEPGTLTFLDLASDALVPGTMHPVMIRYEVTRSRAKSTHGGLLLRTVSRLDGLSNARSHAELVAANVNSVEFRGGIGTASAPSGRGAVERALAKATAGERRSNRAAIPELKDFSAVPAVLTISVDMNTGVEARKPSEGRRSHAIAIY